MMTLNQKETVAVLAAFEVIGPERVRKGLRAYPWRGNYMQRWASAGDRSQAFNCVSSCFAGYAFGEGKAGDFGAARNGPFREEATVLSNAYENSHEHLQILALEWLKGVEVPPVERSWVPQLVAYGLSMLLMVLV